VQNFRHFGGNTQGLILYLVLGGAMSLLSSFLVGTFVVGLSLILFPILFPTLFFSGVSKFMDWVERDPDFGDW
jgi:hypothetical protein